MRKFEERTAGRALNSKTAHDRKSAAIPKIAKSQTALNPEGREIPKCGTPDDEEGAERRLGPARKAFGQLLSSEFSIFTTTTYRLRRGW